MRRIDINRMAIDQGEVALFSDCDTGGPMWTGSGLRTVVKPVRFDDPFSEPPAVHCSLCMWDMDSEANARVEVSAANVTETGFDAVFRTWGDTRVARARIAWMAIGAVSSDDDWDVS